MAVVAAVAAWLWIPESPERTPARVDLRGALILGVGITAPLLAISRTNTWGWTDTRTLGLAGFGAVVLWLWVRVERRTTDPLADMAMLASRPVLMTNLATLLVGFGMFASFLLVPQFVEAPTSTGYGFGFSATEAGMLMLPASLTMLVAGPMSGLMARRFGSRIPLALGGFFTAAGLLMLGLDHGTHGAVLAWNLIASIGVGLAFAAMPNLIVEAVPRAQTGEATGFNALVRSIGSSLGSQVASAIVAGSAVAGATLGTESGFTAAFLMSAGIAAAAGVFALFIPARGRETVSTAAEIGAAAPLGDPAYADERF
jgi:hypothetical protein